MWYYLFQLGECNTSKPLDKWPTQYIPIVLAEIQYLVLESRRFGDIERSLHSSACWGRREIRRTGPLTLNSGATKDPKYQTMNSSRSSRRLRLSEIGIWVVEVLPGAVHLQFNVLRPRMISCRDMDS
jgi:hypothetical protein